MLFFKRDDIDERIERLMIKAERVAKGREAFEKTFLQLKFIDPQNVKSILIKLPKIESQINSLKKELIMLKKGVGDLHNLVTSFEAKIKKQHLYQDRIIDGLVERILEIINPRVDSIERKIFLTEKRIMKISNDVTKLFGLLNSQREMWNEQRIEKLKMKVDLTDGRIEDLEKKINFISSTLQQIKNEIERGKKIKKELYEAKLETIEAKLLMVEKMIEVLRIKT